MIRGQALVPWRGVRGAGECGRDEVLRRRWWLPSPRCAVRYFSARTGGPVGAREKQKVGPREVGLLGMDMGPRYPVPLKTAGGSDVGNAKCGLLFLFGETGRGLERHGRIGKAMLSLISRPKTRQTGLQQAWARNSHKRAAEQDRKKKKQPSGEKGAERKQTAFSSDLVAMRYRRAQTHGSSLDGRSLSLNRRLQL